jgi:hypothetical protein
MKLILADFSPSPELGPISHHQQVERFTDCSVH